MNWKEVSENPDLQDRPFKFELNRFGQIVMSPASSCHGALQARMSARLLDWGGEVIAECSVQTSESTKVADMARLKYRSDYLDNLASQASPMNVNKSTAKKTAFTLYKTAS